MDLGADGHHTMYVKYLNPHLIKFVPEFSPLGLLLFNFVLDLCSFGVKLRQFEISVGTRLCIVHLFSLVL